MFSLGKARDTLERWFHYELAEASLSLHAGDADDAPAPAEENRPDQRVQQFIQELRESSQEWFGRVRMISFDTIRERVGPRWDKLRYRVEILAEKIIRDEMGPRDRYLNAGEAEFLVFFADATPEESRIRCLAIVEMIHEKLFGIEEDPNSPQQRIAECHVVHKNDLILEWELAASDPDGAFHGGSLKALRKAFRHDPEVLDGADIAQAAQSAIDSIIAHGTAATHAPEQAALLAQARGGRWPWPGTTLSS